MEGNPFAACFGRLSLSQDLWINDVKRSVARVADHYGKGALRALLGLLLATGISGATPAYSQSNSDRAFLEWAIQIEIQQQDMGRIAERRAQIPAVRELGTYLLERHRQAESRLRQIASRLGVALSNRLSTMHLKVQRRFTSIPSANFDRGFIRHEIGDYRYFIAHFEAAAASSNPSIRQYAANELASLRQDQTRILTLAHQVS
jgi:predicted outer membrane protein